MLGPNNPGSDIRKTEQGQQRQKTLYRLQCCHLGRPQLRAAWKVAPAKEWWTGAPTEVPQAWWFPPQSYGR